jgi:hypothetical protein
MKTEITTPNDGEALPKLIEASKAGRLTAQQETEAIALLKTSLLGGKAGIAAAIEPIMSLPWIVGTNAATAAWPEMKALARKQFLAGLNAQQTVQGRRFRLSLGRAMLATELAVTMKLIHTVCAEMLEAEGGPSKDERQIFANVLVGKGKPWLLHLPLAELKASEITVVAGCTIAACYSGNCPPLTQLSVLRWIATAGGLKKLPDETIETIAKAVGRWPGKLQAQLKADVQELPAPIEAVLAAKPEPEPQPAKAELQQEENPEQEQEPQQPAQQQPRGEQQRPSRHERKPQERQDRQERPPQQQGHGRQGGFDLIATLRQIEAHVQSLRSELSDAKAQLKQREPSRGRGNDRRQRAVEPTEANPAELEELQRHNRQLEETITELRQRLDELTSDHEDIAASMRAHEEAPLPEGKEQLQALLGIKLREFYQEFENLGKEPPDEVFREHYRLLLLDVFEVLEKQGIPLK